MTEDSPNPETWWTPKRERTFRALLLIALGVWLFVCAAQRHMPVNPASRYAAMEALVEHGTWSIDDTSLVRNTVDKVYWDGHFYSSKPPLLPGIGSVFYWAAHEIGGLSFSEDRYTTATVMRIFMGILPWLLGAFLFGRLIDRFADRPSTRVWGFTAVAIASLPTAYASHLDNHSLAVVTLIGFFVAAAPIFEAQLEDREVDTGVLRIWLAGLLAGLTFTFDLGAAPLIGVTGLLAAFWCVRARRWDWLIALGLGALLAPATQFLIQYEIAGTWKPFYMIGEAYDYQGSYWRNPSEFDALSEPRTVYAMHALFGHHGLFSVTPWLLVGLGWFVTKEPDKTARVLGWTAGVGALVIIGYYIMKTTNYGGRCVGMRWFMVIQPILALAAVRFVDRHRLVERMPLVLGLLLGVSATIALLGAINPWEESIIHVMFRALGAGSVEG